MPAAWHGRLELFYQRRAHRTDLVRERVGAPLKIQRPFYPEGPGVCHSVLLHTAGGIVGGDRLSIALDLGPNAQVVATTAAATKLYRSVGPTATQTLDIHLGAGACLEWLPQEAIAFSGSMFYQRTRIDLEPGAVWLGAEVVRLGRSARGEQFLAGDWRSALEVWQGDVPLWVDRQWIPGDRTTWSSPHGLANRPVVGSWVLAGWGCDRAILDQLRNLGTPTDADAGISWLEQGLVARYRGASTQGARAWFTALWQGVRSHYLGRSACPPRTWV